MNIKLKINSKIEKKEIIHQLQIVLFKSMIKMHELATINCPVDTGRLSGSIILSPSTPNYSKYFLSDGVEYGVDVEYGTSPHQVNIEELRGWAKRVLGNENSAYAIGKKISIKGTEAQPFFRPAFDEVKAFWVKKYFNKVFKK